MAKQVPPEALRKVEIPVLVLNATADVANQAIGQLLALLPIARCATCEGDHGSTPFHPSFQEAVSDFFKEQWRARGVQAGGP
jgi:hypothetical protein